MNPVTLSCGNFVMTDGGTVAIRRRRQEMIIQVPDEIAEEFLDFLDVAQAGFLTDEDVDTFSDEEKAVVKFVEDLLADRKSGRFPTREARNKALASFAAIFRHP